MPIDFLTEDFLLYNDTARYLYHQHAAKMPIYDYHCHISPQQVAEDKQFGPQDMQGKVWLLNVWSSWCVSCRAEHPLLVAFSQQGGLPIVGLNYKEVRGDGESDIDVKKLAPGDELKLVRQRAAAWLAQHGNPYTLSALDLDGRVGIDYGVYGVPETYLIDKHGVIRYKQIGPITEEALVQKILPLAKQLEGQS